MTSYRKAALEQIMGRSSVGWNYAETVKTPRPSCIEQWNIRHDLRALLPGEADYIAGFYVKRINNRKSAARFVVNEDGIRRSFEQVLAVVSEQGDRDAA